MAVKLRTQKEEQLLRLARQYARMKKFGISVESDGVIMRYSDTDAQHTAEYLGRQLLYSAVELLGAMTIDEVDGNLVD